MCVSYFAALAHDQYFVAGAAVSMSLTNGGPSPDFLSPLMYNTLIGKDSVIQLEDITDWNIRDKLAKVRHRAMVCLWFQSAVLIKALN